MKCNTHFQLVSLTLKKSLSWIILLSAEILLLVHDWVTSEKITLFSIISVIITLIFTIIELRDNYKKVVNEQDQFK